MKQLHLFLVCCLMSIGAAAQPYLLKGTIADTLNNNKLPSASVVLIRSRDSVIETYTRSDGNGRFSAQVRTQGKYYLRITFPGFVDYVDEVNVKKNTTDLGELPLMSREHLLKEFVFTQQIAAIKIKGDTTEYMADSFKVKEGATVEDLLKRLPGIQVDKNGQIVAQGESVQKVLVDGEEFFSDDPKVVTRGLQADAVKKVQVYDKKSDQADFTGIDDGQKTRTINLELKEDKKKGYFGKLDAGAGTDGFYQNQGMLNSFRAKRQFSAFGIASNTDKAGLGWQDSDKFGSGNGTTEITEDGEFISSRTTDDFSGWDGRYTGEGLPTTLTGGTHYANKWKEGKHHLTANYRFGRQGVDADGNTDIQYSLPNDSIRVTEMRKYQTSTSDRHGADLMPAPATPRELLIVAIARLLDGCRHVAVGASSPIPASAAMLLRAQKEQQDEVVRISVLGSQEHNFFTNGGVELFDCAAQGRIDAFFLGGGQIDGQGRNPHRMALFGIRRRTVQYVMIV